MKKLLFCAYLTAFTVLQVSSLHAQQQDTCGECPRLPAMYVDSSWGNKWIANFSDDNLFHPSKRERLRISNGIQKLSYFYPRDILSHLLATEFENDVPGYTGIRIYFARYNSNFKPDDFPINSVRNRELILLFAAVKDIDSKPVKYHFIDSITNRQYDVPDAFGSNWTYNFKKRNLPNLNPTVDQTDDSNDDPDLPPPPPHHPSDTRSIYYCKTVFNEAIDTEYNYQLCKYSITISGLKMFFAAFGPEGKLDINTGRFINKKRLCIVFSYMQRKNGEDVDLNLENQDDFLCRDTTTRNEVRKELPQFWNKFSTQKREEFIDKLIAQAGTKLDNGQLCPTYCP